METVAFKVSMLGDMNVGKTTMVHHYVHDKLPYTTESTIGAAFHTVNDTRMDKDKKKQIRVKLSIWDTAGQERFRSILPIYFRQVQIIFLVFDVSQYQSFKSLEYWVGFLEEQLENIGDCMVYFIGNKTDLDMDERIITEFPIFVDSMKNRFVSCQQFYVSAKTHDGLDELFDTTYDQAMEFLYKKDTCLHRRPTHGGGSMNVQSWSSPITIQRNTDNCCF